MRVRPNEDEQIPFHSKHTHKSILTGLHNEPYLQRRKVSSCIQPLHLQDVTSIVRIIIAAGKLSITRTKWGNEKKQKPSKLNCQNDH